VAEPTRAEVEAAIKELAQARGLAFLTGNDFLWGVIQTKSRGVLALLEVPEIMEAAVRVLGEEAREHIAHPWE